MLPSSCPKNQQKDQYTNLIGNTLEEKTNIDQIHLIMQKNVNKLKTPKIYKLNTFK